MHIFEIRKKLVDGQPITEWDIFDTIPLSASTQYDEMCCLYWV